MVQASDHFVEIMKQQTYSHLVDSLADELGRSWEWEDLFRLLGDLGVRDPYGFLAAGWWVPPGARSDRAMADLYIQRVRKAMDQGRLPVPQGNGRDRYTWDHVRQVGELCEVRPVDMVMTLLWQYAATLGEDELIDRIKEHAAALPPANP